MVTSVQPSSYAPLTPLPINPRPQQTGNDNSNAPSGDSVTVSPAAARAELDGARAATDLALAAGREGAGLLSQIRDVARQAANSDDASRAGYELSFQSLLTRYSNTINSAISAGADLLSGGAVSVTLDPSAAPISVNGYDLRLKDDPGTEDALRLSTGSTVADPTSALTAARDADASLARVDAALSRLSGAAQRLNAHDQFLGALDAGVASQVSEPADADGARLLALRASQELQGANAAIANSAPQAVLGLFRG